MSDNIDREVFERYEKEVVDKLTPVILEELKEREGGPMNGRDWCEEHDIPENAFADAINWSYDWFNWGVSPMLPWIARDSEHREEGWDDE